VERFFQRMHFRLRQSILLFAFAAALCGCSSVQLDSSGEMVAVYQFGEFKMLLNTTAPRAALATQRALQQMDLYQTSANTTRFEALFTARARNDQKVVVSIAEANSVQTLVRIRWGEGGSKVLSRRLFELIESNVR
jgi:ABC-type uncharacterized transport system auxiliary subunit